MDNQSIMDPYDDDATSDSLIRDFSPQNDKAL